MEKSMDILFHTNDYIFSYRVAGICIKNDKILLQKPINDTAFAFPGGHVTLGETNEQTLMREFREEIDADINVGDLKWVGELFFPWGNKQCHQICLYYNINIKSDNKCLEDIFIGKEQLQERLAKIAGGVAVIGVGAATEVEMKDKKLRIEDALSATKAAVE